MLVLSTLCEVLVLISEQCAAAALEEEYDDAAEPEPEEGDAEEGALLSPTGAQLRVVAPVALLLLCWCCAHPAHKIGGSD